MNKYKYIVVKKRLGVTNVFLNRLDSHNALNEGIMLELTDFCSVIRNDVKTRLVVFRSNSKNFSVGADLKEPRSKKTKLFQWKHNRGKDLIQAILNIEQITICLLQGYCLGGAAVIASACDFRIAEENTKVGYPEINFGMNLNWLGLPLAINLVGVSRAKQMVIGGDFHDAEQLASWGFIDEVFTAKNRELCLKKWVTKYAAKPPLAAQMIKRSSNELAMNLFKGIMHMEFEQFMLSASTEDHKKAIEGFLSKKPVKF